MENSLFSVYLRVVDDGWYVTVSYFCWVFVPDLIAKFYGIETGVLLAF